MLGQQPRNDAGVGDDFATICFFEQVIADESAQFILEEAVKRARRRHRARLAINQLISEAIVGVPFEELVDGHPNRNFGRDRHAVLIAPIAPRDTCRR